MKKFIADIIENLKSNGFPVKRVSLPTDRMYEAADSKGLSFNQVLEQMKSEHNIDAQIGNEKIIFSRPTSEASAPGKNPEDMLRQAQEMMAKMDPQELRKLQEMFTSMSPEQKEEIMKKGKDFGLI